ncbi:pathogenesis-related thaumatin-like protein 3.5 isoform X2 [Diospyros lotus]|uniref:pathogenesis-related thaumatin-like protein 3.5 isoform X2 n=1 Tax=Diospyros lotus TaxID=55363 RepID=UPI00225B2F5D|nr:pathogenesis-related thaumatin-like protein 3.5 isoform X2 [Diospyros lotus]
MASQLSKLTTLLVVLIASGVRWAECTNFTIVNNCKETIWPGVAANDNYTGDGFALKPGESGTFTASRGWGGRIWGRTGCNFDKNNTGTCQTGSCGSSLKCSGPGQPPFSIAEFNLGETDYYDVSLVDGFNLPLIVAPVKGKGNCSVAGCDSDLRANCPSELAFKSDGKTVACRSACNVFDTDEYCCRGKYADPDSCRPTNYSRAFKQACPAAYSFAHDDPTSLVTCSYTDYILTFCSSRNQTACTYHDKQFVCNGSESFKAFHGSWWIVVLGLLPMLTSLGVKF